MTLEEGFFTQLVEEGYTELADVDVWMLKNAKHAFDETLVNTVSDPIWIGCQPLYLMQMCSKRLFRIHVLQWFVTMLVSLLLVLLV